MTEEKFETEINTLKKFFEIYCKDKHHQSVTKLVEIEYKYKIFDIQLTLCKECRHKIAYSFKKLQNCPHEEKPRCRKCPNPCYEKSEWKNVAKVMKYSAIKLGLKKIKSPIDWLFS